jgi:hypothetical protein
MDNLHWMKSHNNTCNDNLQWIEIHNNICNGLKSTAEISAVPMGLHMIFQPRASGSGDL